MQGFFTNFWKISGICWESTQLVLSQNVGPTIFRNLSYICQKTVRKLSVTKIYQKTVRNVSENCQISVRSKKVLENYQIEINNVSYNCQKQELCHKCVAQVCRNLSEFCQTSFFSQISDTFQTYHMNHFMKKFPYKSVRNLTAMHFFVLSL